MNELKEKIKTVLDRECCERFRAIRHDAERNEELTAGMSRCDDGRAFPTRETCWLCHKHDSLAKEIMEIQEGQ